jgi:hypothetical protein
MVFRFLVGAHRWLGVALCIIFLLWFPSGIGMMYWTYPTVSARDRLERSPALDATQVKLTPIEAAERIGIQTTAGPGPPEYVRRESGVSVRRRARGRANRVRRYR